MARKITCIVLCIILLTISLVNLPKITRAATAEELNAQKAELEQNIKDAEAKMKELEAKSDEAKTELEKLNDEIAKKEAEVNKITEEVNTLTAEVNDLTKQLEEAQENYDKQYDMLGKRLAAQYKQGKTTYLDVLLNSSTISDFISKYYMIEKLAECDTRLLKEIEEQKQVIDTAKREVEIKQQQAQQKQAELKLEQLALSNTISNKNKYLAQLDEEEQATQKEIDSYNELLKQTDSAIQEIARQSAGSAAGFNYTGGALYWPTTSYRITSGFGYRGSAATGGVGTSNHNGYDIGAAHYSDVYSAEDGIVTKVVSGCTHDYPKTLATRCYCGGGYGNYIMISHGGGLTTLYGHVATVNVSVGQTVSRGQKIAEVGSCGWSTGYHLHFSVLKNGTYVDPGNYF